MIMLMEASLTCAKDLPPGTLPSGWYYGEYNNEVEYAGDPEHQGELFSRTVKGPGWKDMLVELKQDGVLEDFHKMQRLGVRGEIHLADNAGPEYVRISLMDSGVFQQTGSVIWDSKLQKI